MRQGDHERPVWIVTGALGGLALGVLLIPLRSLTSASNLAFVFMAFTIVMAELGGRSAALVTADLWEADTRGFDISEGRTLTIAALILSLELARRQAT